MGGVRRRRYRFIMNRSTLSFSACLVNELLEEKKQKRKQNEVAVRHYPLTYSSLMLSIYTYWNRQFKYLYLIVIGSPRNYFSQNWRATAWVSNCRYPIGYLRHSHVNYAHLHDFLHNVFYSVSNFFSQKKFSKEF